MEEIEIILAVDKRIQERLKKENRDKFTFRDLREERINLFEGKPIGYRHEINPFLVVNNND